MFSTEGSQKSLHSDKIFVRMITKIRIFAFFSEFFGVIPKDSTQNPRFSHMKSRSKFLKTLCRIWINSFSTVSTFITDTTSGILKYSQVKYLVVRRARARKRRVTV